MQKKIAKGENNIFRKFSGQISDRAKPANSQARDNQRRYFSPAIFVFVVKLFKGKYFYSLP